MNKERNCSIDIFRLVCAILVVAIHTKPFLDQNSTLGFVATQILPRIAVPFFFLVSGFYYIEKLERGENCAAKTIWKTFKLYLFWSIVYFIKDFIIFIFDGDHTFKSVLFFFYEKAVHFLYYGAEYHLWYFVALLISMIIIAMAYKLKIQKAVVIITVILFVFGLLGESYYYIGNSISIVNKIINISDFATIRRIFLTGLPFFSAGYFVNKIKEKFTQKSAVIATGCLTIAYFLELIFVCKAHLQRNIVITLLLYPLTVFVLILLIKYPFYSLKALSIKTKSLANYTYYIHPLFISLLGYLLPKTMNIITMTEVLALCFLTWIVLTKINRKTINWYVL